MLIDASIKKEKEKEILTDGLRILAKIIAREEIRNQSLKVNEFTTFLSIGSNLNNNVIKRESKAGI
jgi:hypothetical protein